MIERRSIAAGLVIIALIKAVVVSEDYLYYKQHDEPVKQSASNYYWADQPQAVGTASISPSTSV